MKPSYLCQNTDCERVREGLTPFCSSCNHANRKAERQAQKDAAKVKKPIKKVADKRAAQLREYAKLRKEYLSLYPVCEEEGCQAPSVDIHHQRGKENERLLDTNFFLATCREHHNFYTEKSKEAIEVGFSLPRNTKI